MTFARTLLWISALAWAGFGVMLLLWPERLAGVGLDVATPLARVEVRGFYGGLELGLAAFLAWSAWGAASASVERVRSGLVLAALAPGATAAGRLAGIAIEGGTTAMMWSFVAVEATGCALCVAALARLGRAGGRRRARARRQRRPRRHGRASRTNR